MGNDLIKEVYKIMDKYNVYYEDRIIDNMDEVMENYLLFDIYIAAKESEGEQTSGINSNYNSKVTLYLKRINNIPEGKFDYTVKDDTHTFSIGRYGDR